MQTYIDAINAWLAPVSLTFSHMVTGLAALAASFIGARFGTAESRRQFGEKTKLEKLVAAGELITMIQSFERDLQDMIFDIRNADSSDGRAGKKHIHFGTAELNDGIHTRAAVLGADIVEDTIVLAARFARAKNAALGAWEFESAEDAVETVLEWSAALVIGANALANRIAYRVDLKLRVKPTMDLDELTKIAGELLSDHEYDGVIRH